MAFSVPNRNKSWKWKEETEKEKEKKKKKEKKSVGRPMLPQGAWIKTGKLGTKFQQGRGGGSDRSICLILLCLDISL